MDVTGGALGAFIPSKGDPEGGVDPETTTGIFANVDGQPGLEVVLSLQRFIGPPPLPFVG